MRDLVAGGFVDRQNLLDYYERIEPQLYRYPAIDPATFRQAVTQVVKSNPGPGR